MKNKDPLEVARNLKIDRYPNAVVVFAAGSIFRGEGSPSSDIDLVVLYEDSFGDVKRETIEAEGWLVEVFIHNVQSMSYFFDEDRKCGMPVLINMVYEGVEIPGSCVLSRQQKTEAKRLMDLGPPPLNQGEIRAKRYAISDLLDDLCGAERNDERYAILSGLFAGLADFHLRANNQWSGKGKGLSRALRKYAPEMADAYSAAFGLAFQKGQYEELFSLADDILKPHGGRLLHYEQEAGPEWRSFKGS